MRNCVHGPAFHVAHHGRLPIEFRMLAQELRSIEFRAAGMPDARDETHVRGHLAVHHFALHGAHGFVRRHVPGLIAVDGRVAVAAEGSMIRHRLFCVGVVVIGEKGLSHGDVDLAFVFVHELIPASVPRVG